MVWIPLVLVWWLVVQDSPGLSEVASGGGSLSSSRKTPNPIILGNARPTRETGVACMNRDRKTELRGRKRIY